MANKDYINNTELENVILRFKKLKLTKDQNQEDLLEYKSIQEKLANFFYELSKRLLDSYNFNLIDYDEALQEGVLIALQRVERFDHSYIGQEGQKSKAFNYITTCILNHFRHLYRGAKNDNEFKLKYYNHLIESLDYLSIDRDAQGNNSAFFKRNDKFDF